MVFQQVKMSLLICLMVFQEVKRLAAVVLNCNKYNHLIYFFNRLISLMSIENNRLIWKSTYWIS